MYRIDDNYILHSHKTSIRDISFFYRNFYFLSTSHFFFFFIKNKESINEQRRNKNPPISYTHSSHVWPKGRPQASVGWSSAIVNRSMFKSPVQRAEETRTTISVARGTHENGRLLLPREGSAFRERQHDKRRLGKNFEDDTCTWDARQTANLRWRIQHITTSLRWVRGPSSVYGAPIRFWFISPSVSMQASFAVRK